LGKHTIEDVFKIYKNLVGQNSVQVDYSACLYFKQCRSGMMYILPAFVNYRIVGWAVGYIKPSMIAVIGRQRNDKAVVQ